MLAAGALALTAHAGGPPNLNLSITGLNSGGDAFSLAPTSSPGPDQYTYDGAFDYFINPGEDPDPAWQSNWVVEYDGADPMVDLNFSVTNNTGGTETFIVTADLPLLQTITGGSNVSGDFGGFVLDGAAGTPGFIQVTGDPVYMGLVDGSGVLDLGNNFDFQTNNGVDFLPDLDSGGFVAGPATANTSIGIMLVFTLTDGDTVTVNSTFAIQPLPAPGALALLGLAGVCTRRRRRS
jgi:MYXO-CTERM domain-containing protein